MSGPKVVVTDNVFPSLDPAREVLAAINADVQVLSGSSSDAIASAVADADAVLVTYAKLNGDLIKRMKRCRIISRFGIGVDNVDVDAATASGILVTRVPDYCLEEVADHTMALLLGLARKISTASSYVHHGGWDLRPLVPVHRLRGRILGLVGFGQIPQLVAPRAKAFGLQVVSFDPYVSHEVLERAAVEQVSFETLVAMSDFVSIHVPLTAETHHLFSENVFARMKPGSCLINTARGPIVDDKALAQALDRGQLAGAGLDVLAEEPPSHSPLLGRSNLLLTPHMSFYSVESLVDLQTKAAAEVVRAFTGNAPHSPVNAGVQRRQVPA